MKRDKRSQLAKDGIGWAWMCSFGICHWAEPSKADLMRGGKPSPEAIVIKVRISPIRRHAAAKKGKR